MKKNMVKFGAIVTGVGIAVAAMVSAEVANAQEKPASSPTGVDVTAQSIAALGASVIGYLQKYFVQPSDAYTQYLKNTVLPIVSTQPTIAPIVLGNATNDSQQFLATQTLYVPNALKAQQVYAQQVPKSQNEANQKAAYFNSASLLNATTLSGSQLDAATNYVNFLAGAGIPVQTPTGNWLTNNTSSTTAYLNSLGTYSAELSTGLNVFFNMLEERRPQSSLQNKSALQFDSDAANGRMNADWVQNTTTMSPADLQRESVIIQAETRYELYETRMQLEQLNATMANLQLQLLQVITKPAVIAAAASAVKSGTSTS